MPAIRAEPGQPFAGGVWQTADRVATCGRGHRLQGNAGLASPSAMKAIEPIVVDINRLLATDAAQLSRANTTIQRRRTGPTGSGLLGSSGEVGEIEAVSGFALSAGF